MTKVDLKSERASKSDSQEDLEPLLQEAFIDFLNKCRDVLGKKYKDENDIDSEVSLYFHDILKEFDNYRTRRK